MFDTRIFPTVEQHKIVTFLEVAVHLERPDAGVLGLAAGVDALLFVHHQPLVSLEAVRLVVVLALAAVQFQDGRRTVSGHLGRVPFSVVHRHGAQPHVLLLVRPHSVQVVAEMQFAVFDLRAGNNIRISRVGWGKKKLC